MGKPLVRFCEGPGNNEGRWVRGTRHAVVACDEASNESLISVFDSHDYLETPVYSKMLGIADEKNIIMTKNSFNPIILSEA